MSKLKILLPGGKSLTIKNVFKLNNNLLSNSLNIGSLILISIFTFLIPFSGVILGLDSETSALRFLLLFVSIFSLVFIFKLVIQKRSFLIEPKGLLLILIFNLILTTLTILVSTLRVSNTFGISGFRYLSGITLMSLIGLFFFINLYLTKVRTRDYLLDILTLGSVFYIFVNFIFVQVDTLYFLLNIPLVVLSLSLVFYKLLLLPKKLLYSIAGLLYFVLILLALPLNGSTYSELFYYNFAFFISYLLVLILYIKRNKTNVFVRMKNIQQNIANFFKVKKGFTPTSKGISYLYYVIALLIPFLSVFIGILFLLGMSPSIRFSLFTAEAQQYVNVLSNISGRSSELTGSTIRSILTGVGADNYNSAYSFFANVILIHGLVGSTIYLILWGYFIIKAKSLFMQSIKNNGNVKLAAFLLFFSIFIPLVFLFSYSSLSVLVVLWFVYALISSMLIKEDIDYVSTQVNNFKGNRDKILKLIILVLSSVGIIYLISLLFSIVK